MKNGDKVTINGTTNIVGHPWTCPICGFVMTIGQKTCTICEFDYYAMLIQMELENG